MMKDLDFDELDQAVNSLMTGISKTPAPQDDKAAEKTLNITPTLSDNERPSFANLEQTAAKAEGEIKAAETGAPVPAPVGSLAARRTSGRFMDVVHPSSDMKVVGRPTVSREGIQLNPIAPRVPATVAPQPSSEPESTIDAVSDQPPVVVEQSPAVEENAWPDPIDIASSSPAAPTAPATVEEAPAPVPETIEASIPDVDEPAPLQTPFLADTKVEKRPLGAFAVEQQAILGELPEDTEIADVNTESAVQPSVVSEQQPSLDLPDELQHDLVKIESDNEVTQEERPPVEVATQAPAFAAPVVTPAPAAPAGPASIQPQYKEEPSSTKEEHAAIYDTDSYHKPLAHPAKKKSGWLWVLWIILLLALGAGGAAALYYFKLI